MDVDAILANARERQTPYPLRYTNDMIIASKRLPEYENTWISNSAMTALGTIAVERVYAADWTTVNQLCDWNETWALAVLESDVMPRPTENEDVMENYLIVLLVRAEAYEYQYDFAAAAAIYDKIQELNWQTYGNRSTDAAISLRAAIALRQNPSEPLDVAALENLAERRNNNPLEDGHAYQETRLVIARALNAQGKTAAAKA